MTVAPFARCRRALVLAVLLRVAFVAEAQEPVAEAKDTLEFAVFLLVVSAVVFVLVKFHTRFLLFFTRHDRVHLSVNQLFWLICCRCGGTCHGEWTRFFTSSWLCCWYPALIGVNLKRYLGQRMGIVPIPVRMSNIIVGDLPCYGRSSFYVEVSAGDHPSQTTSVQEEQDPKAVQFEDTLIFHTRDSPAERKVRIVVKELNVLGFRTLCDCYISSKSVLRWQKDVIGPRRVRMTPHDRGESPTMFPPWILLEFTPRPEWNNRSGGFSGGSGGVGGVSVWTQGNTSVPNEFPSADDFKERFPLRDPRGARSEEPLEEEVRELDDKMRSRHSVLRTCWLLLWLPLVSFLLCHFAAFICFDGYFKIQVFVEHNQSFPIPRDVRELVEDECGVYMEGNEAIRYARHLLLLQYRRARYVANATNDTLHSVAATALDDLEGHLDSTTSRRRRRRSSKLVGAARHDIFDIAANAKNATQDLAGGLVNVTGAASEIAESANSTASAATQRLAGTTAGGGEAGADVRAAGAAGASEPADENVTDQQDAAVGADGVGAGLARSATRGTLPLPAGVGTPTWELRAGELRPLPASVLGNSDLAASSARQDAGETSRRLGLRPRESQCRPTMKQVLEGACAELPERAQPPTIFEDVLLGMMRCPKVACSTTRFLDKASGWVIAYVAVWVLCNLSIRGKFSNDIDDLEEALNLNRDSDNNSRSGVNSSNDPGYRGDFEPTYVRLPTQEYSNAEREVSSRQSGGTPPRWPPFF